MADALGAEKDEWLGRTLAGRYRVDRRIGEGGIGAVYLAEHLVLGHHVAVKVLHAQFATTDVLRTRFEREAKALSVLSHPNIVRVLDFGRDGDALFLVMDLVEGESLSERLRRGPIAPRAALDIMRQILRALAVAHTRGIVHRDLKPGNVISRTLPDGSEHVVVLDFGLVKFEEDVEASSPALTRQGSILGTPAYMAPEQVAGGIANAPADVYSASHIFFELLTGRRVFQARDGHELFRAHLIEPPPRLSDVRPDLGASAALEAFFARGLAKSPDARFPDARAMLEAFDALPEVGTPGRTSGPYGATSAPTKPKGNAAPIVLQMAPIDPATAAVSGTDIASSRTELASPASYSSVTGATTGSSAGLAPQRKIPWVAIGGVLLVVGVFVVIGLGVVADYVTPDDDETATSAPGAQRPIAVESEPSRAPQPTSQARAPEPTATPTAAVGAVADDSRPRARNPWLGPVPDDLAHFKARMDAGWTPTRGALRPYYRHSDARADLLLGHAGALLGWQSDALNSYRDAYKRDPTLRGDPSMLPDLLNMVGDDYDGRRASNYVVEWYGREALAQIDVRLAATRNDEQREGLSRLRARIAGSAR